MRLRIDERRRILVSGAGGGILLLLFGAVFAASGGFALYRLLTGGEITVNGRPGTPADAWLPGIFVLVGAAVALARYRRVIDLSRQTRTRSFRVLLPVWSRRDSFATPERVTLSRESRGSGKNRSTVYPVRVVGGPDQVEVCAHGHEHLARREAEAVARLADVPLHDSTGGTELVRAPEDLDRSVLETEDPGGRPEPPEATALDVREGVRGVRIAVPPAKGLLLAGVAGFAVMAVPTVLFWLFAWRTAIENPRGIGELLFAYAPLLMLALAVLGALAVGARRGLFGMTLEVARGELVARSLLASTRIAGDDVEELRTVGRGFHEAVLARSDERALRFGFGLGDADREYLRAALLYYLHRS